MDSNKKPLDQTISGTPQATGNAAIENMLNVIFASMRQVIPDPAECQRLIIEGFQKNFGSSALPQVN